MKYFLFLVIILGPIINLLPKNSFNLILTLFIIQVISVLIVLYRLVKDNL